MELLAPFDKLSVVDRNGDVDGKHSETPLCYISFWGGGTSVMGTKKGLIWLSSACRVMWRFLRWTPTPNCFGVKTSGIVTVTEVDRPYVMCTVLSLGTSKCPCQISPKPLIMSLFFNFTAPGSSILFSIRCIIFEVADSPLTVSKWCLTSSTGSFVKSLAFGQMLLSVPGRRGSKQWCGSHAYVTPAPALALAMKSLGCSRISEMEPLWMLA